jgi:hypothetical protein
MGGWCVGGLLDNKVQLARSFLQIGEKKSKTELNKKTMDDISNLFEQIDGIFSNL